jgi:uncharacterized membrane protein HdeD (DUF308 family)
MSFVSQPSPADLRSAELESLRKSWFWLLILGVLLIVVGLVAMSSWFIATLATVTVVGTLLLVGGGVEVVTAFWAHGWRGFWMHLLGGVLYVVLGFFLVQRPLAAAAVFTLMVAAAFLVGGVFRIVIAVVERFHSWPWVLLNGIVTLVLGILIWQEWPESAFWVIGLFVGIDMLFAGWSCVMAALAVRGMTAKPL